MSCNIEGCLEDVQFLVDSNLVKQYFCGLHGLDHKKKTAQLIKFMSDEESENLVSNSLKPKIENCTMKMIEETNDLIEILKKNLFSKNQSFKHAALSSESIIDWALVGFRNEVMSFLIDEAKNISHDLEIFTPREIDKLNIEIRSITENCDKKMKELEQKVYETEKLKKLLDKKTEKEMILSNKETLNQILENLNRQEKEMQEIQEKEKLLRGLII